MQALTDKDEISEVYMKSTCGLIYALALPAIMVVAGCESVALMPRPDIDRGEVTRRDRDIGSAEQNREYRGETREGDRNAQQEEVVGTVESVNTSAREIRVRTPEAQVVVIKYDPNLLVRSRDRELQVDALRRGDLILVQVTRNQRGERYADLIRMNDRQQMESRPY